LNAEIKKRSKLKDRDRARIEDPIVFSREDKTIIRNLRREREKLDRGLIYHIPINGVPFEFSFTWASDCECDMDYNGKYTFPRGNPELQFVAESISEALGYDVYDAHKIPAVVKARKEVDDRIRSVVAENDRLAKKYKVDDLEFFETFIL